MLLATVSKTHTLIVLIHSYCAISPLAFALFSTTLANLGHNSLSYRISKLAKKLVNRPISQRYASAVLVTTAFRVDWIVEPIQIVAENVLNGHTSGLQVGDLINARVSFSCSFIILTKANPIITYSTMIGNINVTSTSQGKISVTAGICSFN